MSIDLNKVFDLKCNVLIEACAGAGKTWLLSKRYAAIMDDFARQYAEDSQAPVLDASNVLVITFTRKAAAEMSERIYADLNRLLDDQALEHVPVGFGKHLRSAPQSYKMHLRSTFSRNAIATIDSFCTQILRDQAEDLDIDPEFRIQDEVDTQRMEMETWESFLRERSRSQDQDLKVLLENLSEFHLNEYVRKLLSHAQLMMNWLDYHASRSPQELEHDFRNDHPLPAVLKQVEKQLIALVDDFPDSSQILDPQHPHYQKFLKLLAFLGDPIEDDYLYGIRLFEFVRLFGLISNGNKYLDRVTIPSGVYSPECTNEIRNRLKSFVDELKVLVPYEILTRDIPTSWDLAACTVQHHLSKFFLSFWKALNQRLKREGVLSFNEVIFQTHRLLQNPRIAAHYGQRFTHILFDEFQDTNDLRWDIVRLIALNGQTTLRRRGLFIVGDTKQSIYRFNQADVQVMNQVKKLIHDHGGRILTADETFRSSRKYVEAVINPLSSASFPPPEKKEEIELYETFFQPTRVAVNSPLTEHQHQLIRCQLSAVLEDEPSRGSAVDVIYTAGSARKWLSWIDENKVYTGKGPALGILLRTFTHILDYIRIFTNLGLDFEVLSSKGLFKQQESYDIYHLLSVLINPLDDLALVGLLRSPFFVITDAEIQLLREQNAEQSGSGWVWQALFKSMPETAELIRSWTDQTAREPLDRLITNILSRGECRLGWISETGGTLRLANLERLIDLIHQLSLDGLSLREIHEYFKFQIQHGDAPQMELPGAARIQILSIHKAKGLEFPVVILPELHAPAKSDNSGIYLGRNGENWQAGISLDTLASTHKTSLYEKIKARNQAEELAEEKRLFYVALTRAQYGVGFVVRINPIKQPASNTWWSRYLKPVFEVTLDKATAVKDPRSVQQLWQERSTSEIIYDLVLGSDLLAAPRSQPPVSDQEIRVTESGSNPLIYEEISPHTIMTWIESTSLTGGEGATTGDRSESEVTALTFGRLLHRAMELEWFDVATHAESIVRYLEDEELVDLQDQQKFIDDLADCLTIYRQSNLAAKLSRLAPADKLAELPVFGYLKSDSRVYKVSGIIDLLYREGKEWIILDYKSDRKLPDNPEQKEYSYWYQIQTYLWILKLMFGIHARGELYFNRFDQTISIEFEPELYFSRLAKLENGRELKPVIITKTGLSVELRTVFGQLDDQQTTILIEPTKYSGEQITLALATAGMNHPRLRVMTLSEFRKLNEPAGRRLSPYLARLGVARLLGKQKKWGTVNRLATAFYKALQGETVVSSKEALFQTFLAWCEHQNILLPGAFSVAPGIHSDVKIIIDSIHSTAASDYQFLTTLARTHQLVFIHPMQVDRVQNGFNMSVTDWSGQDEIPVNSAGHTFTACFSIREEVLLCANKILKQLKQGTKSTDILVAVSSMERYVPVIKQVFGDLGISVRISKREPVMERPVIQLVLALIQGRLGSSLSWDRAMSVWLHPLVLPAGSAGNSRLKLDIEARKLGITSLDDTLPDHFNRPDLVKSARDLLKFVSREWRKERQAGLSAESDWLLEILNGFQLTRRLEPGSVAAKAYTSLKNALISIRNDWDRYLNRAGSLGDLHRELKEQLKNVEVSSARQGFGVDIISILDTLNLHSDQLFVLGMTEGQFPLAPDPNPYLKPSLLNPWFLNLYLFKQWLERPQGTLHLSSPLRNSDGSSLQESTFCQYLVREDFPELPALSKRQKSEQMSTCLFLDPETKHQSRHNALLSNPGQGSWYGKLLAHDKHSFEQISASAFDDLIKCPQRYWYGRMLRLEPAETNIAERQEIEVGTLVHQVLEEFGNKGGFITAGKDLPAALQQLKSVALELIERKKIDLDADLLNSQWRELYFRHFHDPEKNLLAAMLKIEADTLRDFNDKGLHEQAFGNDQDERSWPTFKIESPEIRLTLRGQIDRVLVSGAHVWATDYKTGKVDIKDSREFWTSQMLFYYLVLKSRFPEKNVVLTYEQLKAYKNNDYGIKAFLGDTSSEHPVIGNLNPKSNTVLPISPDEEWSIDRIQTETLGYAQYLVDNSFPLTDRPEKQACAHCHFDRICRKTALPR